MIGYVLRRLAQAAATIVVAVALIFLAVRVLPGHPLLSKFGQHVDPQQLQRLHKAQGWDRPLLAQLGDFAWRLMTKGELGDSLTRNNQRVSDQLRTRVPATIELTFAAMMLAIPIGVATGIAAAVWRNRPPDYLCSAAALLSVSVPVFFLGICLRAAFPEMPPGFRLPHDVFDFEPLTGLYTIDTLLRGRFELFLPALKHLCLPALALSSIPLALIARITRSSMLEVLSADYVRTARAKGNSPWRIVLRHALPNASVPIANLIGLQTGMLLSGAVVTETVFDWPGLGKYIVDALLVNDYAEIQGGAIVVVVIFVSINWLLDVLFVWLDPRIHSALK